MPTQPSRREGGIGDSVAPELADIAKLAQSGSFETASIGSGAILSCKGADIPEVKDTATVKTATTTPPSTQRHPPPQHKDNHKI
jgi:hypothetical protein